jgi:general secretion pathway protein K
MTLQPQCPHRRQRAAALLAVLWLVALLVMLVASTTKLLDQDMDAAIARRQVFRARMLAEAALAIAMSQGIEPDDPLLRRQFGEDESYEVQISGEDGYINPNVALGAAPVAVAPQVPTDPNGQPAPDPSQPVPQTPPPVLANPGLGGVGNLGILERMFTSWGMSKLDSDKLLANLRDWVDPDDFRASFSSGAESREYKALGMEGMPFNRPFRSLDEMAMVLGMGLIERGHPQWRKAFSLYGAGQLNLTQAPAQSIVMLTGCSPELAQRWVARRTGPDGVLNTQDDPVSSPELILRELGVVQTAAILPLVNAVPLSASGIGTRRITIRVKVGDLQRDWHAVVQQGNGAYVLRYLYEGEGGRDSR